MSKSERASPKPIRVPDPVWTVCGRLYERLGTTRSERIIQHLVEDVRLHGTPEEQQIVEETMANRPKRGPKPKTKG